MEKKVLSIIDLSKQLHLSQSTISLILNGKAKEKRISEITAQRVLDYVKKVGYKPNFLAKSLRTGKTNIISLMVEDIANPFFANVAKLIEENAYEESYKILYCSHEGNSEKARELIQMFIDRHVDGCIITPTEDIKDDIDNLTNAGIPVVLFDRHFGNNAHNYIALDNFQSTYNAVAHLQQQNYKHIAFITINSRQSQMEERRRGFETAVGDYKLAYEINALDYQTKDVGMVEHITNFLTKNRSVDAIIFSTNYLGINGLKAIKQMKLLVPSEIGIVCFDDNIAFELFTPTITCVAQPIKAMSIQLINFLLSKLSFNSETYCKTVLPGTLIVRESSVR